MINFPEKPVFNEIGTFMFARTHRFVYDMKEYFLPQVEIVLLHGDVNTDAVTLTSELDYYDVESIGTDSASLYRTLKRANEAAASRSAAKKEKHKKKLEELRQILLPRNNTNSFRPRNLPLHEYVYSIDFDFGSVV